MTTHTVPSSDFYGLERTLESSELAAGSAGELKSPPARCGAAGAIGSVVPSWWWAVCSSAVCSSSAGQ